MHLLHWRRRAKRALNGRDLNRAQSNRARIRVHCAIRTRRSFAMQTLRVWRAWRRTVGDINTGFEQSEPKRPEQTRGSNCALMQLGLCVNYPLLWRLPIRAWEFETRTSASVGRRAIRTVIVIVIFAKLERAEQAN